MTFIPTIGFINGIQASFLFLIACIIPLVGIILLIVILRKLNGLKDKIDKLQ